MILLSLLTLQLFVEIYIIIIMSITFFYVLPYFTVFVLVVSPKKYVKKLFLAGKCEPTERDIIMYEQCVSYIII